VLPLVLVREEQAAKVQAAMRRAAFSMNFWRRSID
jgi:hypothetical protein